MSEHAAPESVWGDGSLRSATTLTPGIAAARHPLSPSEGEGEERSRGVSQRPAALSRHYRLPCRHRLRTGLPLSLGWGEGMASRSDARGEGVGVRRAARISTGIGPQP